jgi:hypothetical protein
MDENNVVCPYCGAKYQPESADFDEEERSEECEKCGQTYFRYDEVTIMHHARKMDPSPESEKKDGGSWCQTEACASGKSISVDWLEMFGEVERLKKQELARHEKIKLVQSVVAANKVAQEVVNLGGELMSAALEEAADKIGALSQGMRKIVFGGDDLYAWTAAILVEAALRSFAGLARDEARDERGTP